ncbi:MAG: MBL fold metallo-hydrolase [Clostridia bacterium]|nr:MBL fold metallo-hydrolase [Clostridia bacterium]
MIKTFENGLLSSNVHLIYSLGEGMIVDCGVRVDTVKDFILENNIEVKYIVLTHGHYDHCGYLANYIKAFPMASVICHTDEVQVLTDSEANVSEYLGAPCVYNYDYKLVNEGDKIRVGELEFSVLHTPGHTPGGICLLCKEQKLMLTGDTLFKNGYGRYDFKYGDFKSLRQSLLRLLSLDGDIVFYSGHGEKSTIEGEQ